LNILGRFGMSRGGRQRDIYLAERQLKEHPKNDPAKLVLAAWLGRETPLTIRQIAQRPYLGSWQSLNNKLYLRNNGKRAAKQ
jgi:hypothetical protein